MQTSTIRRNSKTYHGVTLLTIPSKVMKTWKERGNVDIGTEVLFRYDPVRNEMILTPLMEVKEVDDLTELVNNDNIG